MANNTPAENVTVATMNVKGITRYSNSVYNGVVNAKVVFKPYAALGDIWVDRNQVPIIIQSVEAVIENGILKDKSGNVGVKLYASTPDGDSNIEKSQWTAIFLDVTVDGVPALMNEILFDAVSNGYVRLEEYVPVPGQKDAGIIRGPRGTVIDSLTVEGSNLVIWERQKDGKLAKVSSVDLSEFSRESARIGATQAAELIRQDLITYRNAAATSAANAKTSETRSKTSENNSKKSENNVKTSENNVKTSEDTVKTIESNIKTIESNIKTSESNAANSANTATTQANRAETEADRAAGVVGSTRWEGDKLVVNGATSPSLTGPRGPKGDPGTTWAGIADKPDLSLKADLQNGLVPTSQLPSVALTKPHMVSNRAAMLSLKAEEGDVAVIATGSDKGTYMLGAGAADSFSSWIPLVAPTDAVTSVNGQTGVVNLTATNVGAAPTSHTHTTAQVTGLDAELARRIPTKVVSTMPRKPDANTLYVVVN